MGGGYDVSRDDNRPPTAEQWLPDSSRPTEYERNAFSGCYRRRTPRDNHQEGLDYELDDSTGFWRRKTTAAARPPNLPGPGQSHWTPDLREPPNMYREQR